MQSQRPLGQGNQTIAQTYAYVSGGRGRWVEEYTREWRRYPNRRVESTVVQTTIRVVDGSIVTLCGMVDTVGISEMHYTNCRSMSVGEMQSNAVQREP